MDDKRRNKDIYSSSRKKRRDNEQYDQISANKYRRQNHYQNEDEISEDFEEVYSQTKRGRRYPNREEFTREEFVNKKEKKKKSIFKRILLIIIILAILLASSVVGLFFYYFSDLKTDKTFTANPNELGLTTTEKINKKVINIALFGVDSRDDDDSGRSDTTMVASFDGIHKEIKLTSLLRDSQVKIDGHGKDKLCHAYSYGGPQLAVKTINQNYRLDIMEYITVNFTQMAKIIDAVGGLDILITEKERVAANGLINSTPDLAGSPMIPGFGAKEATIHLTGAQAVSYARIRKIDSETQRVGRQQTVLQALFDRITKMGLLGYPKLIKTLLPYVETSLSYTDVLKMLPTIISSRESIKNFTIPDGTDKSVFGGIVKGIWYWVYDLENYSRKLYDFIYEAD